MPQLSVIRAAGLLAIILWTASASAANEAPALTDTDGSTISIETKTISRKDYIVHAWQLRNFAQAQDDKVLSSRSQMEFNCRFKQSRVMWVNLHTERDAGGETISSAASAAPVWVTPAPGSLDEVLLERACTSFTR